MFLASQESKAEKSTQLIDMCTEGRNNLSQWRCSGFPGLNPCFEPRQPSRTMAFQWKASIALSLERLNIRLKNVIFSDQFLG